MGGPSGKKPVKPETLARRARKRDETLAAAQSVRQILHNAGITLVQTGYQFSGENGVARSGVQVHAFVPDSVRIEIVLNARAASVIEGEIRRAFWSSPAGDDWEITRLQYTGRTILYATRDMPVVTKATNGPKPWSPESESEPADAHAAA